MINLTVLHPIVAVAGADELIQAGQVITASVGDSWNGLWIEAFDSPLFFAITRFAALIAMGCIIVFTIQYARDAILMGDVLTPNTRFIWAVVLLIGQSGNGRYIAGLARGIRSVIHQASHEVLRTTFFGVNIQDAIQGAIFQSAFVSEMSAQLSQCQGMVGEVQKTCLAQASAQVDEAFNLMDAVLTGVNSIPIVRAFQGAVDASDSADGFVFGPAGFFGGFLGSHLQPIIQTVLLAFQWGFANCIEISLLLTALMGPLAFAACIIYDGKPLFAWLTGLFTIGMAQISYNIIIGLAAVVIVNSEQYDTNGFLVIIALLAPALALAIAGGGGLAVFQVISSGSASLLSTVAHLPRSSRRYGGVR